MEITCPKCGASATRQALTRSLFVCPACGYHHHIGAYFRLSLILDSGSFRELDEGLTSSDPLKFPGYAEKLELVRQKTGMEEAVVTATGRIEGRKVAVGVLDSRFFMGSMRRGRGRKGHAAH